MTKIKIFSIIAGLISLFLFVGCTRIEPGYVGIKVNNTGSNQGVEDYPAKTGWVFYFPITTRVYEYPTFQQNVIWCQSSTEGSDADESITFNTKGGAGISADVSLSGKFIASKVPFIFTKFRTDPKTILHSYLRNEVRDAISRIASRYEPISIVGGNRSEFLDEVKAELKSKVGEWFEIDYVTFPNKLRLDPQIEATVNNIIAQQQRTAAAVLKVQETEAEAKQAVAEATGKANSALAIAEGKAKATLVEAEAQAKANRLLSESITPTLTYYRAINQWNGYLPNVLTLGDARSPNQLINISTNSYYK
jgi:regulator of protease activity HflC (stomatin/prohibitin superfamily)